MSSSEILQAVELCLERRVPFCAFIMPGETTLNFWACDADTFSIKSPIPQGERFFIGEWKARTDEFIYIDKVLDATDVLRLYGPKDGTECCMERSAVRYAAVNSEVDHDRYIGMLESLTSIIKGKGRCKVVLSRCENYEGLTPAQAVRMMEKVFKVFPKSLRHIYFTPHTGAWIGATPELLARIDTGRGEISTMALAGTRSMDEADKPWGRKDVEEQRIVSDYIVGVMESHGIAVTADEPETLTTGNLQHICTYIHGGREKMGYAEAMSLIDALNPTPALCGYPLDDAEKLIDEFEIHERRCYGGVIGIEKENHIEAFVNLRCVNFDTENSCVYGGGGILGVSVPEMEWIETQRKIASIVEFLKDSM